jgi:hypothetical protein
MQPTDVQGRMLFAADRFERLRADAQLGSRATGRIRRRFGNLLVGAGRRLAPETPPLATEPRPGSCAVAGRNPANVSG